MQTWQTLEIKPCNDGALETNDDGGAFSHPSFLSPDLLSCLMYSSNSQEVCVGCVAPTSSLSSPIPPATCSLLTQSLPLIIHTHLLWPRTGLLQQQIEMGLEVFLFCASYYREKLNETVFKYSSQFHLSKCEQSQLRDQQRVQHWKRKRGRKRSLLTCKGNNRIAKEKK